MVDKTLIIEPSKEAAERVAKSLFGEGYMTRTEFAYTLDQAKKILIDDRTITAVSFNGMMRTAEEGMQAINRAQGRAPIR